MIRAKCKPTKKEIVTEGKKWKDLIRSNNGFAGNEEMQSKCSWRLLVCLIGWGFG